MPRSSHAAIAADMQETVKLMWQRVLPIVHQEFSYEEALAISVPKDVGEVLLKAMELSVGSVSRHFDMIPGAAALGFLVRFRFNCPVLQPKDTSLQRRRSQVPAGERFDAWLAERVGLGVQYGRLAAVAAGVASECSTPAQMRVRFPSVRIIWGVSQKYRSLADEHEVESRLARAPFLPGPLNAAVIGVAPTLAAYVALPKADLSPTQTGVELIARPSPGEPPLVTDPGGFQFMPW